MQKVTPKKAGPDRRLIWLGLGLIAALSLGPLLVERRPIDFVGAYASEATRLESIGLVAAVMVIIIVWRASLDRNDNPAAIRRAVVFMALAALLTAVHYTIVDTQAVDPERFPYVLSWQRGNYLAVLGGALEGPGISYVPHVYRPLPYGFTRTIELVTGNWRFACLAYRFFFTYWVLWAMQRFGEMFLPSGRAGWIIAVYVVLYPLSIWYYSGQLTDPLSHFLFILSMILIVEDWWPELALALGLGVLAKETALLLVVAYFACHYRQGRVVWRRTAVLGLIGIAAYFAVRLHVGWVPDLRSINSNTVLMIRSNLGLPGRQYKSIAPLWQNYLNPILFVIVWLAPAMAKWRAIDAKLKAMAIVLVPLMLGVNLCFGWLYESRNYVPLLPLLVTMALAGRAESGVQKAESQKRAVSQEGRVESQNEG
jgi:hypothetical protein